MQSAARRAVAREVRRHQSVGAIALGLQAELAAAFTRARLNARVIGAERLDDELSYFGLSGYAPEVAALADEQAESSALSMAASWRLKAGRGMASGLSEREAASGALSRLESSLSSSASWNVADAWQVERDRVAAAVTAGSGVRLGKIWDATLDNRVCPTCARSDGDLRYLEESFALGTPGTVHPRCRCIEQIRPASWLGLYGQPSPGLLHVATPAPQLRVERGPPPSPAPKPSPKPSPGPKPKPELDQPKRRQPVGRADRKAIRESKRSAIRGGRDANRARQAASREAAAQAAEARRLATEQRRRDIAARRAAVQAATAERLRSEAAAARAAEARAAAAARATAKADERAAKALAANQRREEARRAKEAAKAQQKAEARAFKDAGITVDHAAVSETARRVLGEDNFTPETVHRLLGLQSGFPGERVNAHVAEYGSSGLVISGNSNGSQVVRTFTRDRTTGELVAKNDLFTLPEHMQGNGIGKNILRSQLSEYERLGVARVRLEAAWQGQYVWPRMGYSAQPAELAAVKSQFGDWLESQNLSRDLADVPATIHELSILKHDDGSKDGRKLGKEFLQWRGNESGHRLISLQLDMGADDLKLAKQYLELH